MIDIGNECIECRRDTVFGSGLFVNRIPADNGELNGWLCPECQEVQCGDCGEQTIAYTCRNGYVQCDECAGPE